MNRGERRRRERESRREEETWKKDNKKIGRIQWQGSEKKESKGEDRWEGYQERPGGDDRKRERKRR